MNTLDVEQMSLDDKLLAMEELWESLTRDEAQYPSPNWHVDALNETKKRNEAGLETPLDWETTKQALRSNRE